MVGRGATGEITRVPNKSCKMNDWMILVCMTGMIKSNCKVKYVFRREATFIMTISPRRKQILCKIDDSLKHWQERGIELMPEFLNSIEIAYLTSHDFKLENKAMILLINN